jgi:WD40 repeat protein
MFPAAASAAACSTGAFAHEILLGNLSFFPDGATLITAGRDMFVKFWVVSSGALFRTVSTSQVPYALAVSPDGNWIAVGMAQGDLELWAADGSNQRALAGHSDTVGAVAFTPNSQRLVSASLDFTTKVWSVADATLLQSFTDTTDVMSQVAVPAQGRFLVSAGTQTHLRLLSDGSTLATRPGTVLALSPDGGLLATHDQENLYLSAFPSLDLIASVPDSMTATALAFSGDGRFLAVSLGSASPRLYSAPALKLVSGLGPSDGLSLSVGMDSLGHYLAVASGKNIQLYSLPQGTPVPVCFMDVAASSPAASGIQYTRKGVNYTVPCGAPIPAGAVCTCNCVPGFCPCVQDTGCGCVSDTGCDCVSDSGCSCVSDTGCGCVSDTGCGCVSDTGCDCVSDPGCDCVSDYGCGCVSDTGCGCVSDSGCGCDGDTGCGCDGDTGCGCDGDTG